MKLINSWTDERYLAENFLYQFPNGVLFLYTIKKGIKDYTVDVMVKGGSAYESQVGVPSGTAHFLEHFYTNPNKKFKNSTAQDKYTFGTAKRASIFKNASTWKKMISFYTFGHPNSLLRSVRYLRYLIDYPEDRLSEFIERERGAILAELNHNYKKEEKDSGLAYEKFMYKGLYNNFTGRIIGNSKSINSITVEDIKKYRDKIFTSDNVGIAIQSNKKLSKSLINEVEQIAKLIPNKNTNLKINKKIAKNKLEIEHFSDENEQGMFISLNYFIPTSFDAEYLDGVPAFFTRMLISHVGFKTLREELGLVYGIEAFRSYPIPYNYVQGFKFTTEKDKFLQALNEFNKVLTKTAVQFLNTEEGKVWLEAQISKYVYMRTINYDADYSQRTMFDILCNERLYIDNWNEAKSYAQKIKKQDIIKYLKDKFITEKPKIWMVSPESDEFAYDTLKKSDLYKTFSN